MPLAYGLVDPVDLPLPRLPQACHRLRIAHLSDLHLTARRGGLAQMIHQLTQLRLDLIALTGDYMYKRDTPARAIDAMGQLCDALRPRLGVFGVFGNHDTADFRAQADALPVTWLNDQAVRLDSVPVDVLGFHGGMHDVGLDGAALALNMGQHTPPTPGPKRLRLLLTHYPSTILTAADLGADLVLAGHSHGGQWRLPTGRVFDNASDMPLSLTAGLFRHRNTLMAVSRGLGEGTLPWRFFCPRHVPVYTLRQDSSPWASQGQVVCYRPW